MYKLICLPLLIIILSGCGGDQLETKDVPDNLEIDINQDGMVDFQIIYSKTSAFAPVDPDPGPLDFISGRLAPQNGTQVLKREEETSILFLNDINLVENVPDLPLFWEADEDENSNVIVSIGQNFDGETWPEEWRIRNVETKDSYLVGFKLSSNNSSSLGYIELSIDNQTGQAEILSVEFK